MAVFQRVGPTQGTDCFGAVAPLLVREGGQASSACGEELCCEEDDNDDQACPAQAQARPPLSPRHFASHLHLACESMDQCQLAWLFQEGAHEV